ncbi:MAG: hypothetical protein A2Y59_00750 [Chloroflexi bacterium RBG_13_52_14]|nr:MAG: hypothetical protein A2Y59_00750 [Chloroflexi bacterium RBG_13_52_14]
MEKEFAVWFNIQTEVEFNNKETYPKLKIVPHYSNNKLEKLEVNVKVTSYATDEINEIVEEIAYQKIKPLIERLGYLARKSLEINISEIKQTNPPQKPSKQFIQISPIPLPTRLCSMPKEDDLVQQDSNTTDELMFYNRAAKARDLSEKIKNFYMVIEKEEGSRRKRDDLTNVRDALSHPELNNQEVINFLQRKIGSNSVDYNNPNHVRFLRQMLPKFVSEAKRILDNKIH